MSKKSGCSMKQIKIKGHCRNTDEIIFFDKNLKKHTRFYRKNASWIDEDGNLTSREEIEYQLKNYAKKGSIEF